MAEFDSLKKRAEELGIPVNSGVYKPNKDAWSELQITNYELHRRIQEEERRRREHRLWIVAALSAAIAVSSAVAAWLPIFLAKHCP